MRSQMSWLLLLYSISVLFTIDEVLVCGRCLEDQRSLLLQLHESLSFNPSVASKLASWNTSTDCCRWKGVTCGGDSGHVTGLDLSSEYLYGGIDNSSSSLFNLRHLQSLNLAYNCFESPFPSGLVKLVKLTNLNLTCAGFTGQVPIEISRLTRLVSLDLSNMGAPTLGLPAPTPPLRLKKPDLKTLVQNLSELRTLRLDGVIISANGSEWCRSLSSLLPNLQVLSLSNCDLSGPPDSSLSKLRLLSQIDLSFNDINAEVPIFFQNFMNLSSLGLNSCGLYGKFPERILQLRTLQSLDISNNPLLHGSLPEFPRNWPLSKLDLSSCSFNGSIPSSIIQLNQLDSLDLSLNSFTGPIPPLPETLTQVNLAHNSLTGPLPPDSLWKGLVKLVNLDLRNNSLNGRIPSSLFTLPTLKMLQLNQNQFSGQLMELHHKWSYAPLEILDLSSNKLEGPIPLSIFELQHLSVLTLSYNNFNGTIELEMMIQKLQNLTSLDLSYNSLMVNTNVSNSNSSFPHIGELKLASCKLRRFPDFLRNLTYFYNLDLSNNQIYGKIPTWVWNIGGGSLVNLNLSFNFLNSLEQPLPNLTGSLWIVLDLHSNLLQGPIPVLSSQYLDFSNNSFQSSITSSIIRNLFNTIFFSLSSNNMTGEIPSSICNAGPLQVLDLSNNGFSGTIPSCLADMSTTLTVLNLRLNHFIGQIPQKFPVGCALRTLDLSGNGLQGPLPATLAKCINLEVLNLDDNRINGTFPFWLGSLTDLRVLVLRYNRFSGPVGGDSTNHTFPKLQIVDLSSNNFKGNLPSEFFMKWTAMMENETPAKIKNEILGVRVSFNYYQDVVTVTIKGREMELVKILTVYTSVDLSNNGFQGEIPDVIGNLTSLYALNLSHNTLNGGIPSSLGNLKQLESLDLSHNKLEGEIPQQLTSLTFLSVLNLSWNKLTGMIPTGNQFQTFTNTSFEGNKGLCGDPLSTKCTDNKAASPPLATATSGIKQRQLFGCDWQIVLSGFVVGYGGAVGMVVAFFFFSDRGRKWLMLARS